MSLEIFEGDFAALARRLDGVADDASKMAFVTDLAGLAQSVPGATCSAKLAEVVHRLEERQHEVANRCRRHSESLATAAQTFVRVENENTKVIESLVADL